MEIPGLSPLSNQSTLTNPLNQRETLQGQQTQAQPCHQSKKQQACLIQKSLMNLTRQEKLRQITTVMRI